jgi:hypothetical protein
MVGVREEDLPRFIAHRGQRVLSSQWTMPVGTYRLVMWLPGFVVDVLAPATHIKLPADSHLV